MSDKVEATMYLYAYWNEYDRKWSYAAVSEPSMETAGWVKVESKTVQFDRPGPDADWSKGAIELTRKEQQRIRAEAEAKCNALDERINSMLALEHKVVA